MTTLVELKAILNPLGTLNIFQVCINPKYKSNSIVCFLRLVLNRSIGKEQTHLVNVDKEVWEPAGIFLYCS